MNEEIWPFVKPLGTPSLLGRYLRFDNWSAPDALLLLMGICPEPTWITRAKDSGAIIGVRTLDNCFLKGEDEWTEEFIDLCVNLSEMQSVWDSGDHPDRNPPSYYIEWATSKGFEIPWLKWGQEQGLTLVGVPDQLTLEAPANADKPISAKERNTLLTIIAALCDYSAIKHQERGAAIQIAKMTDEIGAPVNDDTVRTVLAKIPAAVETRMK